MSLILKPLKEMWILWIALERNNEVKVVEIGRLIRQL